MCLITHLHMKDWLHVGKLDTILTTARLLNVTDIVVKRLTNLGFILTELMVSAVSGHTLRSGLYAQARLHLFSSRTEDVFSSGPNQRVKAFSLVGLLDWLGGSLKPTYVAKHAYNVSKHSSTSYFSVTMKLPYLPLISAFPNLRRNADWGL